ncbi:MAG: hypothetical protein V4601_06720 [Pseudomonadota bacterium]
MTDNTSPAQQRPSVVERAFQIAKSGKVANVPALQAQLADEGYPNGVQALAGRALSSQLMRMITESRTAK